MGVCSSQPSGQHPSPYSDTETKAKCVTTKLLLLLLTTAPACARLDSPEMTLPELSSPPLWADPDTRESWSAWDRRTPTLETRHSPREESSPSSTHRARHCDQLGRHGEDLAPHLLQRA